MSRVNVVRAATVAAVLFVILSPAVRGQRSEGELTDLFAKSAANVFERAKATPSADSATLLRDLILQGADRLASDKRTSDREISAVVEIIRRFAGEMVKHGVRQPDGTLRLGETSFTAAQKSLCPLYPFC